MIWQTVLTAIAVALLLFAAMIAAGDRRFDAALAFAALAAWAGADMLKLTA